MKELLEKVLAVLEYTGPGKWCDYTLGVSSVKLERLREAAEDVLASGAYDGRVEARDLLDVPGCH